MSSSSISNQTISISDSEQSPGEQQMGDKSSSKKRAAKKKSSSHIADKIEAALFRKATIFEQKRIEKKEAKKKDSESSSSDGSSSSSDDDKDSVFKLKITEQVDENGESKKRRVQSPRHKKTDDNPLERDLRIRPPDTERFSSKSNRRQEAKAKIEAEKSKKRARQVKAFDRNKKEEHKLTAE